MFTEALQHPVMIPDGGSLIFTGRKVALQLRDSETDPVAQLFIILGREKNVFKIGNRKYFSFRRVQTTPATIKIRWLKWKQMRRRMYSCKCCINRKPLLV